MSEKKKILVFIDWFLPGYKAGGPIRSVANMVDALHKDFDFYIVTSDRDLGDKRSYSGIRLNCWIKHSTFSIQYLSPENQNKNKYREVLTNTVFYKVYFNSLFSYKFTLLQLKLAKKTVGNKNVVIAPRGMLGKGALKLKRTKKNLFLLIVKTLGFYKNIIWHATSLDEKKDIIKIFGKKAEVKIAGNIPKINHKIKNLNKLKDTRFYYLSRISKKKNLHFAVDLFKQINSSSKILFDIFGPVEDEIYWNYCKEKINLTSGKLKIEYKGPLKHEINIEAISKYHFLILPTLHENYGHVIYEALSVGTPVIISDQTPWKDLETKSIGWDISLNDKDKFQKVIQTCIDMNQKEYNNMSKRAFVFAQQYVKDKLFKSNSLNLFHNE